MNKVVITKNTTHNLSITEQNIDQSLLPSAACQHGRDLCSSSIDAVILQVIAEHGPRGSFLLSCVSCGHPALDYGPSTCIACSACHAEDVLAGGGMHGVNPYGVNPARLQKPT